MKRYAFATAVMLLVVFPWRQSPQADAPVYTIEALGDLSNIGSLVPLPTGINASGQISGTVTDPTTKLTRAVRYTDGAGWEYVPGLTWNSSASGINIHGDIVGTRNMGGKVTHGYRYNFATGLIDDILPLIGDTSSTGLGINDLGDVVGQSDAAGVFERAFVAHPGLAAKALTSLGNAGATNDQACGINNSGQMAGFSTLTSGLPDAVRWEPEGTVIEDAGTLDPVMGFSSACAIDEAGTIGGFSSKDMFASFPAFRWSPGNAVNASAGLPGTFANVESISNAVSVGWYQLDDANHTHLALMYTDANGAVDVNTLLPANSGWVLSEVKGINGSGQMVGHGLLNGVETVFRMGTGSKKDTTPPVIAPHADVTAEATGTLTTVTYVAPATSDDVDPAGTASCTPASGSTFALGTTPVTCTASDAAGNAAVPTTFNVIVRDTTPPAIAAHADVTAEATGPNGASVSYNAPATTDAVDGNGTATCMPASGSTFALGATTVTCNAKDAAGNAAAPTSFSVAVKDTTAPVIAPHADVTAQATGTLTSVTYVAPATSDAVDGTGTATCSPASGSSFPLGTTTVTCYAKDAAGNAATPTTFKVCVKDTTAPVISMVYASPDTIWPPNGKLVPVAVMVSATDNVDQSPSCSLTSVAGGAPGSSAVTGQFSANVRSDNGAAYVLTVTCSDSSGNKSSASTTVVVGKTNGNGGTPKANGKQLSELLKFIDNVLDRDRDAKGDRGDRGDRDDRRDRGGL